MESEKKIKLNKKQVAVYEEMSGFKTTGDVTLHISSDETFKVMEDLISPILTQEETSNE